MVPDDFPQDPMHDPWRTFMTRVHIQRLVFGLALLTTHAAFAATPINETRPLDPRGRVEIENV